MSSTMFDLSGRRIFVAGHRGMVGGAVVQRLQSEACTVLTAPRSELDLTQQSAVEAWFEEQRPDAVILAAAKVGGIASNDAAPADFLTQNIQIQTNVITAAARANVGKLLFLGSSCIYPKLAPQPIPESSLLTGPLEPTNEWYAIAKIAGLKMCQAYRRQHGKDFISAMPTNLYGPGDNYDPETSHVLPALVRRIVDAAQAGMPEIRIWGTGRPLREFLHVEDLADALVFLLQHYSAEEPINVGCGHELSILDLARLIAKHARFIGTIETDPSRPDGTPRKLIDSTRLHDLGWQARISLEEGVMRTITEYRALKGDAAMLRVQGAI
jgi:GDP-L-fucose synthase